MKFDTEVHGVILLSAVEAFQDSLPDYGTHSSPSCSMIFSLLKLVVQPPCRLNGLGAGSNVPEAGCLHQGEVIVFAVSSYVMHHEGVSRSQLVFSYLVSPFKCLRQQMLSNANLSFLLVLTESRSRSATKSLAHCRREHEIFPPSPIERRRHDSDGQNRKAGLRIVLALSRPPAGAIGSHHPCRMLLIVHSCGRLSVIPRLFTVTLRMIRQFPAPYIFILLCFLMAGFRRPKFRVLPCSKISVTPVSS
ncbi:hypothetical protein BV25DRAFT_1833141 [Artomyces pyxidatus]|uniref:Uncharacterized protein n=1 Tax=Artomyces pyxidatus TaxID=48021 RepID=A0ACB8SHZ4_9AGAM|nr:hypothetical protein BV25DRAFT_1833141 [Artomyces pyxidatus]